MKITTMGSIAGAVILAGSLSWTQAEEVKKPVKPEAARADETTSRSTRESIIRRFDKDGDGKLNDEEKQAVRKALASREQEEREDDRGEGSSSSRRERLMKAFDRKRGRQTRRGGTRGRAEGHHIADIPIVQFKR